MLQYIMVILLFLIGSPLYTQTLSLKLQGEPVEILSSEPQELAGILSRPQFSPFPSQKFSFSRHDDVNRYLYIYDLSAKNLTEIRTVLPHSGINISVEDSILQSVVYNGQLDWRPKPDSQKRQWFAFVSNGAQNNRDIYIGFAGGSNYIRLTTDSAIDNYPRWSPDGRSIAFISYRSGGGDIYLVENVDQIIEDIHRDLEKIQLTQLTDTPLEETHLSWNPDPNAHLLAYTKSTRFPGRQVETFQIRIMDLRTALNKVLVVTNDPLAHYTNPQWDTYSGNKLLFVGQGLLQQQTAKLYLSEFEWSKDKELQNKILDEYKEEIFDNVRLSGTSAIWLPGGEAVICQEDLPDQSYPLFSVNIKKWLDKKERAVNYFEELHGLYPDIREFEVRNNNLIFVTQDDVFSRIYLVQIYGDDIIPDKRPQFALTNLKSQPEKPRQKPDADKAPVVSRKRKGFGKKTLLIAGGLISAGAAAFFLLLDSNDVVQIQALPIGRPPSTPK